MTSAHRSGNRLTARSVAVSALTSDVVDDAFALFAQSYERCDRERFERDLRGKQRVILLHDRDTGALKGFSTLVVFPLPGRMPGSVIFSGDTVIDREYWGQKQLQLAFLKELFREKVRAPRRPLYWFLISKGYRTYLLFANAFARAVPRHDRADAPDLRRALDALAQARFGDAYDAGLGIVRVNGHERVRDGLAPITHRHLANPHVAFFVGRNPGHAAGDELACLAHVRFADLARIALRVGRALLRVTRADASRTTASVPSPERA